MDGPQGPHPLPSAEQSRLERERVDDVELILDNLFRREQATLEMVVDYLYDISSVRFIDRKVARRFFRGPFKAIARLSKPAFRLYAVRRVQKVAPHLIANWLYSQAIQQASGPVPDDNTPTLIDVVPLPAELPPAKLPPLVELQAAEINSLRSRVGWLSALVGVLLVGSSVMWFN